MSMIRLYTFLIFVAIIAVVLYGVFVMPKSDYVGKRDLLIIPNNVTIASNANNIINDLVFIAENAVVGNIDIEKYNAQVEIERLADADIIHIIVYADSTGDVLIVEDSILKSIILDFEKYYDINTDFSIKILNNKELSKTVISGVVSYILMIIIAIGTIAGVFALFYMINLVREKKTHDENIDGKKIFAQYNSDKELMSEELIDESDESVIEVGDADISTQEDIDEFSIEPEIEAITENHEEVINDVSGDYVKLENTPLKESLVPEGLPTTPGNLPIADIGEFGGAKSILIENSEDIKNTDNNDTEPTEEELKARLNELLNGKL